VVRCRCDAAQVVLVSVFRSGTSSLVEVSGLHF
jgi:anaerobic C4-dicarboxylate transporter